MVSSGIQAEHMQTQYEQFDLPFPPRVNPLLAQAESRHIRWMCDAGLLSGPSAVAEYRRWQPAEVGARWFYLAQDADLALGCDVFGWFFAFDDLFDGPIGREPEAAAAVVERIAAVMAPGSDAPASPEHPLTAAFRDLWTRECEGMSEAWRRRAARHWVRYLHAHIAETANRSQGTWLTTSEYLDLRYDTGFMPPLLDMIERVWRSEVPESVYESQEWRYLRYLVNQNINIVNDVLSLDKEEGQGDRHNLVLITEHERQCTRSEAISEVRRMIDHWTLAFTLTECTIPTVCDRLGISTANRTAVYADIEGMRAAIRGNYDWCARTARYAAHRPGAASSQPTVSPWAVPTPSAHA